jgi:hypothetical protein
LAWISSRPWAVLPSSVNTASANSSPSPRTSASSLRNAYEEIRFSMARALELAVVRVRQVIRQLSSELGRRLPDRRVG